MTDTRTAGASQHDAPAHNSKATEVEQIRRLLNDNEPADALREAAERNTTTAEGQDDD